MVSPYENSLPDISLQLQGFTMLICVNDNVKYHPVSEIHNSNCL
jgi:hypothetical protein